MSFLDGLFGPPNVEKLRAKGDVNGLIKALHYKKNSSVREDAAKALCEIGDQMSVKALKIGDKIAVEPFIVVLTKSRISGLSKYAAEALGQIGDPIAVEPLIAVLRDRDSDRCKYAAEALGQIGDLRAVEPLIAALNVALRDRDSDRCKYTVEALKKIGVSTVEPLIVALKDRNSDVRICAAETLGEIGDKRAVESLIDALKDSDSIVRLMSSKALGKIGDSRGINLDVSALKDSDSRVRSSAVEALDKIGWKPDNSENGTAYWSIKAEYWISLKKWDECVKIGAPAIIPLIVALKDSDSGVRRNAAETLEKIGWKPDKGENGAAYWSEKAEYYIENERWIECINIGAPSLIPLIVRLNYHEWSVRKKAAEALAEIYKKSKLDDAQKKLILDNRNKITEQHFDIEKDENGPRTHIDEVNHYDSGPNCCHSDSNHSDFYYYHHTDHGIGVKFPI